MIKNNVTESGILNLMINHHALLETLFVLFRDEAKKKAPEAQVTLSELSWQAKKHFFAEENAIFDFLPLKSLGVHETINRLKGEHVVILNYLKKISDNLPEINNEEVKNLYKLLKSHREVEEQDLYQKLDNEMRADQKIQVVSRINEIPMKINL